MKQFIIFAAVAFLAIGSVFAETECEKHKAKEAKNTGALKLDVKCTSTGEYAPLQCFPGNKFCYCALPDGTQVTQPSRNRKFCSCDIAKFQIDKTFTKNGRPITPPSGTYIPKCQRDGLYYNKQCETGTDICWCVNQDGKQISKEKSKTIKCT